MRRPGNVDPASRAGSMAAGWYRRQSAEALLPIAVSICLFFLGLNLNRQFAGGVSAVRWVPAEFVSRASVVVSVVNLLAWILAWRRAAPRDPVTAVDHGDRAAPPDDLLMPAGANSFRRSLLDCLRWSLALSVPLAVSGQIWHSFDFPTHVFFASHYQRSWWSLWEPRWFEGFDVSSYPPLTHQLSALLGWTVGNGIAVNILTAASIVGFPFAVFALARSFLNRRAAARAAALAVVTPSVWLCGFAFGQLPTVFALDFSLLAGAALATFLQWGGASRLALVLSLVGCVVAAHHATAIFFLPPLLGTIALVEVLGSGRLVPHLQRTMAAAVGIAAVVVLVILPFWIWHSTEYVTQVAIDHQSRHNFLQDLVAQDLFFWAEHGILVIAFILSFWLPRSRLRVTGPWLALASFLFLIGLGGTTGLPRLLFGAQWAWLTYDRFGLWADVALVLLLGAFADVVLTTATTGARLPRVAWVLTLGSLGCYSILSGLVPALVQSQPAPIDPRPIVEFLGADGRDQWRYLTVGFGDQLGILSSLTDAGTIDGDYFTARELPLLTRSGIATIDYSLLWDPNANVLRELLANPLPHALRWTFTRDPAYEPFLREAGWGVRSTLPDGVSVWEAPIAIPPVDAHPASTSILAIWWGIVPLATFLSLIPTGLWVRRYNQLARRSGRA